MNTIRLSMIVVKVFACEYYSIIDDCDFLYVSYCRGKLKYGSSNLLMGKLEEKSSAQNCTICFLESACVLRGTWMMICF